MTHSPAAILGLATAAVLLLIIAGRFFGDFFPMLIFFAAAAFDIFVVPSVPGSPIACMAHHNDPCKGHITWVAALCFLLPLGLAQLYKELRGDGRGTKGTRLP